MPDERPPSGESAYFEYGAADRAVLRSLRPLLEKHADALVAGFYRHLLAFPQTRALLRDPAVKDRLLVKQRAYLISLAGPALDAAYVEERRRIGEVHERIGLEPRWYLGAYALYVSLLTPILVNELEGEDAVARAVISLNKLLLFDAQIAMETYIEKRERSLEYLNRELAGAGRRLAREHEVTTGELRRTTERARAAERLASIGTLVAGLAHEIGTPMGVIQGHARALENEIESEDGRWRVRTIREQIGRISRIIQSLLNMARPSRTQRMAVPLEPLLESTLAFLIEKFERRQIQVVRSYAPAPAVVGDPERLQQLFLNLFLNAADAMPEGGELRITLGAHDAETLVAVVDTGLGIPPDLVERIFDPFVTSKAAGEGNGLGLAVAEGIVADHGGHIEVESREGEGTRFSITFPAGDVVSPAKP